MIFPLMVLCPWSEIPHLPVITIVGKPHLWADQEDLRVVNDNTTIVENISMDDWPERNLCQ